MGVTRMGYGRGHQRPRVLGIGGLLSYQHASTRPSQAPALDTIISWSPSSNLTWEGVRTTCGRESGQEKRCDLLVDAAALQTSGMSAAVRPVVVDALKQPGVDAIVLNHVDRTLAIRTVLDPVARRAAASEAKVALVRANKSDPSSWLNVAKLQFEAGHANAGYESLLAYVDTAAENPGAVTALRVGFVEPVKSANIKSEDASNKSEAKPTSAPPATSASGDAAASSSEAAAAPAPKDP